MKNKGQSLIESLVALTVLVVGVMSAVSLGIYTIRGAQSSMDDLVAMNLAQEGLEGIRWQRDFNWKNGLNWDDGIIISGDQAIAGRMEVNEPDNDTAFEFRSIQGTNWRDFCSLCFDPETGLYFHAGSVEECVATGHEYSGYDRILVVRRQSGGGNPERLAVGAIVYQGVKRYALFEEFYDWWP
jgi:hypothetical protein